jgi:hypothetical protein
LGMKQRKFHPQIIGALFHCVIGLVCDRQVSPRVKAQAGRLVSNTTLPTL